MPVHESRNDNRPLGLWSTIFSVLAAMFGVQSNRNGDRDAVHGNPALFIGLGFAFTLLLVIGIYVVVRIIVAQAGV